MKNVYRINIPELGITMFHYSEEHHLTLVEMVEEHESWLLESGFEVTEYELNTELMGYNVDEVAADLLENERECWEGKPEEFHCDEDLIYCQAEEVVMEYLHHDIQTMTPQEILEKALGGDEISYEVEGESDNVPFYAAISRKDLIDLLEERGYEGSPENVDVLIDELHLLMGTSQGFKFSTKRLLVSRMQDLPLTTAQTPQQQPLFDYWLAA